MVKSYDNWETTIYFQSQKNWENENLFSLNNFFITYGGITKKKSLNSTFLKYPKLLFLFMIMKEIDLGDFT